MNWKNLALVGLGLLAYVPAMAEDVTAAAPAAPDSKIVGDIDIRPSVRTKVGTNHLENTLQLGYQFDKGRIVTVVQYFENNLHNRDEAENLTIYDTFLRTRLSNLAELSKDLKFSYQSRVYLPTSGSSQDKGMVAVFRNYLTLTQKFNDVFTLSLSELPIFAAYSRTGNGAGEKAAANPFFENRVYLIGDVAFTEKLSLSVPIMFHQTRYSNYLEGAKNNNAWAYYLWTYPELSYQVTDNTSVGIAYYSSNLVKADLSGLSIGDGLEDGVVQLVFGANL